MKDAVTFIHCMSEVDIQATLGHGTVVWAFCVICEDASLGERCVVGTHTYIGPHAELGDDVRIQGQCYIPPDIQIGSRVFIGPGAIFTGNRHPRVGHRPAEVPVIIEDDVSVGAHVTVLAGVRLGKGCMIGAGAVVTKDVPAGETWVGNPARQLFKESPIGLSTPWSCGCRVHHDGREERCFAHRMQLTDNSGGGGGLQGL